MSKEHAYAYEAGYRDGSIHYELEHCPACKNVADLQEALAENAKLREQSERLFDKTLELATENSKLRELCKLCEREAENAKLRELVQDMWHEGMCECGSLGKCAACMYEYPTRMHELGVEVDA